MNLPAYTRARELPALLRQRLVILDGAMGTMIQQLKLTEAQFRGERFADFGRDVKGNNELLSLTRPDVIPRPSTSATWPPEPTSSRPTPSAPPRSRRPTTAWRRPGARDERRLGPPGARRCDKYSTPDKPRFVAGAWAPRPRPPASAPTSTTPARATSTSSNCAPPYYEQVEGLVEGGADVLLVETIFDTLNAKAALFAIDEFFEPAASACRSSSAAPSPTPQAACCRGQTVTAFWYSVRHAQPLAVGLNCALGAALMRPYIQELAAPRPTPSSAATPTPACPTR
jgi:5-methyltetrahydrofolate--homocysteine methyltransferase